MPRPKSRIDDYKDEISERWYVGESVDSITQYLSEFFPVGSRTLERRLKQWDLSRRSRTIVTSHLIELIRYLIFHHGYKDSSVLRDLRREGIDLSPRGLEIIQLNHGIKRIYRTDEERDTMIRQAREFLQKHKAYRSTTRQYIRFYLYKFVRSQAGLLVGKNRTYQIYKELYPVEVQGRHEIGWNHRTEFRVPGPNWLWSLDGYNKLADFGFQVWSRTIILLYIPINVCYRYTLVSMRTLA